jgi:electron transfer flavoprotein beta subunit
LQIAVCLKQAPDNSSVYVDPISGEIDVERCVQILNPADACALEAALRLKEQLGGRVVALTLGPAEAEGVLRAALAMGADEGVRLWHARSADWGPLTIAAALATCLRHCFPPADLVLCGEQSSDWASGTVGPALAEYLGLPQITGVMRLTISAEEENIGFRVARRLERGYREQLLAEPPLLLTVSEILNEPRYPSLPAYLAALKAAIPLIDPLTLPGFAEGSERDESLLLEVRAPRPRPHRIAAPDSRRSPFERIGEIIAGNTGRRQARLIEGSPEELARALVHFLQERGFIQRI